MALVLANQEYSTMKAPHQYEDNTPANAAANQRLLDEAWAHITAQGCASVAEYDDVSYEDGFCRYNNHEGGGCAMYPAIRDYDPDMEALCAADMIDQFPDNVYAWTRDVNDHVANEIQRAHDNAVTTVPRELFIDEFKSNMAAVAERYSLVCPT